MNWLKQISSEIRHYNKHGWLVLELYSSYGGSNTISDLDLDGTRCSIIYNGDLHFAYVPFEDSPIENVGRIAKKARKLDYVKSVEIVDCWNRVRPPKNSQTC